MSEILLPIEQKASASIGEALSALAKADHALRDHIFYALAQLKQHEDGGVRSDGLGFIRNTDQPAATDLYLLPAQYRDGLVLHPIIITDAYKVNYMSPRELQAELLRSVGVICQYPIYGFERRVSTVYLDAITFQRQWMEKLNLPSADAETGLDVDPHDLVQTLVPKSKLIPQHGIADYRDAVSKRRSLTANFQEIMRLNTILANIDADMTGRFAIEYLLLRELTYPVIYDQMERKMGYSSNENQRAGAAAAMLLEINLNSFATPSIVSTN